MLDFDRAGVLWAGTSGSGLHRSSTQGSSWSAVAGFEGLEIEAFAQDLNEASHLLVVRGQHVARSLDGGASWSLHALPDGAAYVSALVHVRRHDRYEPLLGTAVGLHRSPDGGVSWVSVGGGVGSAYVTGIWVHPSDRARAWACTDRGPYETIDGGATWSLRVEGLTTVKDLQTSSIACDPRDPTRVLLGTWSGLFLATDRERRWERITGLGDEPYIHDIRFLPDGDGSKVLVATGDGLYMGRPQVGEAWIRIREGEHPALAARVVEQDGRRTAVLVAGGPRGEVVRSLDGGATWQALPPVGRPDVGSLATHGSDV